MIPKVEDGNNFGVSIQEVNQLKKPKQNKSSLFNSILLLFYRLGVIG